MDTLIGLEEVRKRHLEGLIAPGGHPGHNFCIPIIHHFPVEIMQQEAHQFYKDVLTLLHKNGLPFMVGGGFAMHHYTGIVRDTKDLDIFCKPGEYPPILKLLADHGYVTELTDARWLAKVFKDDHFMDIIFNTTNNICTVDDSWYEHAVEGEFGGIPVRMLPPVELISSIASSVAFSWVCSMAAVTPVWENKTPTRHGLPLSLFESMSSFCKT